MTPGTERLILRSTVTSPFGRKVRIAAQVLGLGERIALVAADTLDETDTLRAQNPLGKMPCLLLPDGTAIYDSGVIIEYFQELAGSRRLIPERGLERFTALTLARLADGVTEAALLLVYEGRFRDADKHSERWLTHQRGKIARALSTFENSPPATHADLVSIGLACALGYLDWRNPIEWRGEHPRLTGWLLAFAKSEPAFARSAPDAA
jgi:glutathione S-transferase